MEGCAGAGVLERAGRPDHSRARKDACQAARGGVAGGLVSEPRRVEPEGCRPRRAAGFLEVQSCIGRRLGRGVPKADDFVEREMPRFEQELPYPSCSLVTRRRRQLCAAPARDVLRIPLLLPPLETPQAENPDPMPDQRVRRLVRQDVDRVRAPSIEVTDLLADDVERRDQDGVSKLYISCHRASIRTVQKVPQPPPLDDEDPLLEAGLVELGSGETFFDPGCNGGDLPRQRRVRVESDIGARYGVGEERLPGGAADEGKRTHAG